jgi:SDR family mycofactocin-dependent oxidoreductase
VGGVTRVAVVTGAARGIGAATVVELARQGWSVVALDRCANDPGLPYALATEEDLRAVVAAATGQAAPGARVEGMAGDAGDQEVLRRAVGLAEEWHGGLDAFVAVAGVIAGGVPLWEMPPEEQDAVLAVNLVAVMTAARVAIPALLRRPEPREGRFLAVASAAATRGLPMLAAYCASKAGVVALVRSLAVELRATGVTANVVSPGSTRTPLIEESARLYDLESTDPFAEQQPHGRLLEPEEIAAMLAWLAGPAASGVTGAAIPVDGGLAL